MTRNVRTYDHFCVVARALETVGDRWTLLVIRDLLGGAKRFTDLMDRLSTITPKTLSQRLRDLQDSGVVAVDRAAGRREVWYRLTPVGEDLGPVIDALGWWGIQHAWRRPLESEPLHADHLLRAATQAIDAATDSKHGVLWHFRIDGADYVIECDGERWSHSARSPESPADVTITTSTDSLTKLILGGSLEGVDIEGTSVQVQRFRRLIVSLAEVVPDQGTDAQGPLLPPGTTALGKLIRK